MFSRPEEICNSHIPSSSLKIPSELVIEILMRLPAKSLMRFKSVSKLWSSLICSQYFTKRFLKVSSTPPRLYVWLGFDKNPLKNVLLSSSSSSSTSPDSDGTIMSSFIVDQDLTIPAMEGYSVSQVYRGLMCFINGSRAKIYNATTRQLVVLPEIEGSDIIAKKDDKNQKFMYHIGYDPLDDQYKVFCVVSRTADEEEGRTYMSEHWVLLLGGGGDGWRKISNQCPQHRPLKQRLTINGRTHYLAWVRLLEPVLVTLDVHSEEISIFQEPEKTAFWPHYTQLIEYGGRVAISHYSVFAEEGVMELWVMDDVEKNIWSKKTFELHPSQMHLLESISSFLRVQGTTRDGEVILVPDNTYTTPTGKIVGQEQDTFLLHIFLYNLQNNHMRRVDIKETSNRYLTKIWDVIGLDDVDNLMYLFN